MRADSDDSPRGGASSTAPPRPWHIITGEYPPQPGGVGDYCRQVAAALAAEGVEVHVWAPPARGEASADQGVTVHRLADHFHGRGRSDLERRLESFPAPRRLLVQYVAGAFGMRSMNLPFCLWLSRRRADRVWVMFHEYAYPIGWRQWPHHNLMGVVTRAMGRLLVERADRVFVSTPAWLRFPPLSKRAGAGAAWLPVPSNLPVSVEPDAVRSVRARVAPGDRKVVIGHFGTYAPGITALLRKALPPLLRADPARVLLLVGRGGTRFRAELVRGGADEGRVASTGGLPALETALHLRACDVLVQPYQEGATTRRGSLMAGLALGLPIVTNEGGLSEPIWRDGGAVALASDPSHAAIAAAAESLLRRPAEWGDLGRRAAALYETRFSLRRTVHALRDLATEDDRGP